MNKKNILIATLVIASVIVSLILFYYKSQQDQAIKKESEVKKNNQVPPALPEYETPASGKTIERTINLSTGDTAQVILPEEMKDVDAEVLENIIKRSKN